MQLKGQWLVGLVFSAAAFPALAQHRQTGQLISAYSGACLGRAARPAAIDCRFAPTISLIELPERRGHWLVRDDSSDTCLFAKLDGRFGWYTCLPAAKEQQWTFTSAEGYGGPVAPEAAHGRMLRAVDAGQCLFSNRDGRFGLYACGPSYGDQFWSVRARPPDTVPPPAPPPPAPLRTFALLAGDWVWADGSLIAIHADGTFLTPNDSGGRVRAAGKQGYEFIWGSGRVDRVQPSSDGTELHGTSLIGGKVVKVQAQRSIRPAPPNLALPPR